MEPVQKTAKKLCFVCLFCSNEFVPRERHFGSVVGASGTLIALGGRDGSATPMALGTAQYFFYSVPNFYIRLHCIECTTAVSC